MSLLLHIELAKFALKIVNRVVVVIRNNKLRMVSLKNVSQLRFLLAFLMQLALLNG